MLLVATYWVASLILGWLALWIFLGHHAGAGCWPALFMAVSSFHNAGLSTLSGLPLTQGYAPATLLVISLLVLGGNTCFPMILRALLWILCRLTKHCQLGHVSKLLLKYPRTCYTHLFPGYATTWLCIVTPALVLVEVTALSLGHFLPPMPDASDNIMQGYSTGQQALAIVFTSISTRTAGLSVLDLSKLSPTSVYTFCICMWISVSPVVVLMRSTMWRTPSSGRATARSLEMIKSGTPQREEREAGAVMSQLSAFMSENTGALMLLLFLILFTEEMAEGQAAIRRDRFMSIVFEFCSAYGTVGLSMNPGDLPSSCSGRWSPVSKVLLMVVMFMGRMRGLPDNIDPTFRLDLEDQFLPEVDQDFEDQHEVHCEEELKSIGEDDGEEDGEEHDKQGQVEAL